MVYVLVSFITIIAVELFLRFPLISCVKNFSKVSKKSLKVISSKKISDHWKEKVIPVYAVKVFMLTLKLTVLIICVFAGALLPVFVLEYAMVPEPSFWVEIAKPYALILSCIVAVLYYFVRKRYVRL